SSDMLIIGSPTSSAATWTEVSGSVGAVNIVSGTTTYKSIFFSTDTDSVVMGGGAGNDTFTIATPSTTTSFAISGGGGSSDTLNISSPSASATTWTQAAGSVSVVSGGTPYQPVSYSSDTESVGLGGGAGSETFTIGDSSTTTSIGVTGAGGSDVVNISSPTSSAATWTEVLGSVGAVDIVSGTTTYKSIFFSTNTETVTMSGGAGNDTFNINTLSTVTS